MPKKFMILKNVMFPYKKLIKSVVPRMIPC